MKRKIYPSVRVPSRCLRMGIISRVDCEGLDSRVAVSSITFDRGGTQVSYLTDTLKFMASSADFHSTCDTLNRCDTSNVSLSTTLSRYPARTKKRDGNH